jgi:biopolymer transport protein ExbD
MRSRRLRLLFFIVTVPISCAAWAQSPPAQAPPPAAQTLAQNPAAVTVSLDDAIQMALQHNHTLLAARTTILITSTTSRSSILASAICLSEGKSGSTACEPPET